MTACTSCQGPFSTVLLNVWVFVITFVVVDSLMSAYCPFDIRHSTVEACDHVWLEISAKKLVLGELCHHAIKSIYQYIFQP